MTGGHLNSRHILFLSSLNAASNPRLVKEIRLAVSKGYRVSVICFHFDNWSSEMNHHIVTELHMVNWIQIPAARKPILPWLISVAAETACRYAGKIFPIKGKLLAQAVSRRNSLLLNALKKIEQADLVIGHNPGALYATVEAGRKFNCKTGFDVEDYHPGEGHDTYYQGIVKKLMIKWLPSMHYVSFASPLIRKAVAKDLRSESPGWVTILNCFPAKEFPVPVPVNDKLKMVWFSQHITPGRGLEFLLPVLEKNNADIELHLYGNLDEDFYNSSIKNNPSVTIHAPLPQQELHRELSGYDIGLALEPSKDRNNELAVSNKVLAYLQAGLYVLATDTPAQQQLLDNYPGYGHIFKKEEAPGLFPGLQKKIGIIRNDKIKRYNDFKKNDWSSQAVLLEEKWKA